MMEMTRANVERSRKGAYRRSRGLLLVAAAGLFASGCGGQGGEDDDGGASVGGTGAAEGAGGTVGTGGAKQVGVGSGGDEEFCPASTLPEPEWIEPTYTAESAPAPQGGALPSSGLFEMVDNIMYEQKEGLVAWTWGIVRFRPNHRMDRSDNGATKHTVRWTITRETSLTLANVCPWEKGGTVVPYTFADDELTLYTPNGAYVYRRVEE